jgi:hypothetical protein
LKAVFNLASKMPMAAGGSSVPTSKVKDVQALNDRPGSAKIKKGALVPREASDEEPMEDGRNAKFAPKRRARFRGNCDAVLEITEHECRVN